MSIDRALELFDIPTHSTYSAPEQDLLANITQSFITDPVNKDILSTKKGQKLQKKQIKLLNLIEVRKAFNECMKNNDSSRNLFLRVYTAAAQVEEIKINCNKLSDQFTDIREFSKYINELSNSIGLNELQKNLHLNSFKNLIKTYIFYKHSFDKNIVPEEIVNKLCLSSLNHNVCSENNVNELNQFAKTEHRLVSSLPIYTAKSAKELINQNINEMNEALKLVKPEVDQGFFNNFLWNSSDPLYNEKSEKALTNYQEIYLANVTSGIGSLMMSDTAREKMGRLKSKDQDETEKSNRHKNTTSYNFSPHSALSETDILNSYNDVLSTIEKQARSLNRLETKREYDKYNLNNPSLYTGYPNEVSGSIRTTQNRKIALKRLIKTNPAAVGQLLASSPEYSNLVCDLIKEIESNDKTDKSWDQVFFYGGIVVGGALMVTGLVAIGGVMMARTLASAALFKTVGSYVTVVGAVSGLGESAYFASELAYAKLEMSLMEESFISGLTDRYSITEAKEALKEFNEAKFNLALVFGFTAIDIAGFYAIIRGARIKKNSLLSPEKEKLLKLNGITNTLTQILKSDQRVNQFLKIIEVFGHQDAIKLLGVLGSLDDAVKKKVFELLDEDSIADIRVLMKNMGRSIKECS